MGKDINKARRKLQVFFFFIGILLFAYLIDRLGPAELWEYLKQVGWGFAVILLISFACYLAYTWAWAIFLRSFQSGLNFWRIFKLKVIGEAVSSITPLGWGGGDPVRIWMLKSHIPLAFGTASVVVDRSLNNLAMVLFMVVGIFLSFLKFNLPPVVESGLIVLLVVMIVGSVFLYLRSHEGLFQFLLDLLKKLRIKRHFSENTTRHVTEIDRHISEFYKRNKTGFFSAFFLHFFGRCCPVVEIFFAAKFLGLPLSMVESYLLASMTVIINAVFIFVPGTLGVMEGAFAGSFAFFHLDPVAGTSIQMVRRIRMVFWTALGFVFLGGLKGKTLDSASL